MKDVSSGIKIGEVTSVYSFKARLLAIIRVIFWRRKIFVYEKSLISASDTHFKKKVKLKVNVKLVQCDDIPKIAKRFEDFKIKANERFKMGHICFAAYLNEDILHYSWWAVNEVYSGNLERKLRLSSDSAYAYDAYTVPECRGLGIALKVSERACSYLRERGYKRIYCFVPYNNFPSHRVMRKGGWRKIGTITYTRIFKWRHYQCESETKEDYNKLKELLKL